MLLDKQHIPLEIVDGLALDVPYREVLRPDEKVTGPEGQELRLPRFFYEVDSFEAAEKIDLAPHFDLSEFLETDNKEVELLRNYPKYIPIGVSLIAAVLSLFRRQIRSSVRIAANGGYRSPGHALNTYMSPHCWGTAVNIYKIGSNLLDKRDTMEKYSRLLADTFPGVWIRPYGTTVGTAFDQLHIDVGYTNVFPPNLNLNP